MDEPAQDPAHATPSASLISKAKIAVRGIASLLKPAPGPASSPTGELCDVISPDTLRDKRIPPGQVETKKWPILHAGPTPKIDLATWDFRIFGLIDRPISWS